MHETTLHTHKRNNRTNAWNNVDVYTKDVLRFYNWNTFRTHAHGNNT